MAAPYFRPCLFALVITKGQAVLDLTLSVAKVNYGFPHSERSQSHAKGATDVERQGKERRVEGGTHREGGNRNQPFGASKMI